MTRIAALQLSAQLLLAGTGSAIASQEDFLYTTHSADTLIGLGHRLLLDPQRWHELQIRNRIANTRRLALGSIIRIPYSWLKMSAETATASAVGGVVTRNGEPLTAGGIVPQGSVVKTGTDGSVTINLADGSMVTLQKSSEVRFARMEKVHSVDAAHDILLKLESGRMDSAVKPHHDVGRFEIATPVALSAVRGTHFRTGFVPEDSKATTETLEGTVDVRGSVAAVIVPSGFGTRVDKDAAPLLPVPLLPPPDLATVPATNSTTTMLVNFQAVAGAQEYRAQPSEDRRFQSIAADLVSGAPGIAFPDLADGDYWVRVRSIDRFGLEGPDAVRSLVQRVLPDPPKPLAPTAGERITGTQARLQWAPGDSKQFRLRLAHDPAFSVDVKVTDSLSGSELVLDNMPPGPYFWQVATVNSRGESGPWSAIQSYAQRAPAPMPAVPTLVGGQLRLEWEAQPVAAYHIQVSRTASFQRPIVEQTANSTALLLHLRVPGTYYARVQTIDSDGLASPYGPARKIEMPLLRWVKWATPIVLLTPLL